MWNNPGANICFEIHMMVETVQNIGIIYKKSIQSINRNVTDWIFQRELSWVRINVSENSRIWCWSNLIVPKVFTKISSRSPLAFPGIKRIHIRSKGKIEGTHYEVQVLSMAHVIAVNGR